MKPQTKWAATLLVSASLVLTACSGAKPKDSATTAPAPTKSKQLVIGIWSAPHNFDPITNDTTYGTVVYSLMYPSLVKMNDKLDFVGDFAQDWKISDDHTKFTFNLHKNGRWSDGKPITAEDIKYHIETIANPDTPTTRRADIDVIAGTDNEGKAKGGISGIKVLDQYTIEFTTKKPVEPNAFLEKTGGLRFLPKHVLEPADKKSLDKADFVTAPKVDGGPFHFVKYQTDQYVELAANKDYYKGAPKLDKIFVKVATQQTMLAGVETGEIDVTAGAGVGEIPVADWDKASANTTLTPITFTAPGWQYMDINTSRPELSDKRVRQAIAYAINRKLIVSRLLHGLGQTMNTPLNSNNRYFRKDLEDKYPNDKEKANALLKDANFDLSKKIELIVPTGNLVREQSGDIILQNLKDAGFNVEIKKTDFSTMQSLAKKGEYQLRLVGFSASFDPDFASQVVTGGGFNYAKYSNPQLDQLMTEGKNQGTFADRKTTYDKALELFANELPLLPLYSPTGLTVVNKKVLNCKPGPEGTDFTYNAEQWDVAG